MRYLAVSGELWINCECFLISLININLSLYILKKTLVSTIHNYDRKYINFI